MASFLLLIVFFGVDLFAFPHQYRAAQGEAVAGRILGSWDGGVDVPVAYTPVDGGETVVAIARTVPDSDAHIGPVEIDVDPRHPTDAHLAGFDEWQLLVEPLTVFGPAVAAILLWWWTRRRRMRRSEALAAADVPSFRMTGMPRPGRVSPRRWRMTLYPLDAPVGATPVCSVAMIDGDDDVRPRIVEVKGQPRPGGEVVVWEPGTARVWWPASRVLLSGTRNLTAPGPVPEEPQHSSWRWLVPIAAVIVMLVAFESGENRDTLRDRSSVVLVTVVAGHGDATGPTVVSYRTSDSADQKATVVLAGPQHAGDRYRLRIDPVHPDRLWQPRTQKGLPGEGGAGAEWVGTLAMLALILGIVMVRRPRPRPLPVASRGLAWPSPLAPRSPPPPPPPPASPRAPPASPLGDG